MNDFPEEFINSYAPKIIGLVSLTTASILVFLGLTLTLFSHKKLQGYYPSIAEGGVTCTWANYEWWPDEKVMCYSDAERDRLLSDLERLNATK